MFADDWIDCPFCGSEKMVSPCEGTRYSLNGKILDGDGVVRLRCRACSSEWELPKVKVYG